MRNFRLAFRMLYRTPLVAGVAILSLALGLGANTAIYSLFNELLLQPLPVVHPEQLVLFGGNLPTPGSHQSTLAGKDARWVFSYPMFRDLESQPGPFSGVAAHEDFVANLVTHDNVVAAHGEIRCNPGNPRAPASTDAISATSDQKQILRFARDDKSSPSRPFAYSPPPRRCSRPSRQRRPIQLPPSAL